jgi:hypothetical protein
MAGGIEAGLNGEALIEKLGQTRVIPFGELAVFSNGREILDSRPFHETVDFPVGDPWSHHMRRIIDAVRIGGGFRGDLFEGGVGDGRNGLIARGAHIPGGLNRMGSVIGVDLDGWRVDVARRNFATAGLPTDGLIEGDVVRYLLERRDPLSGSGIACLPQAPMGETVSHADGFDSNMDSLQIVRDMTLQGRSIDKYGLKLNGAFLKALREKVEPTDFNLLIILSGRIPSVVREELLDRTNWAVQVEYKTPVPIQQDPDTGIAYVSEYDDGKLFYEQVDGNFEPIPAVEAEYRRGLSLVGGGRDTLNVYHDLSVYYLTPAVNPTGGVVYEAS